MVIGALKVKFTIMGAQSLKDKRRVLKSLKDRYLKMNVSVAEVDDQDKWQSSTMGFAVTSNDAVFINSILDRITLSLSEHPDIELTYRNAEIMHL